MRLSHLARSLLAVVALVAAAATAAAQPLPEPEQPVSLEQPAAATPTSETTEAAPANDQDAGPAHTKEPPANQAQPAGADLPEPPDAPKPPTPPVELPAPQPAPIDASAVTSPEKINISDWDSDEWLLVKPRISLLDLDGYFRLRGDLLRNLDFGNQSSRYPRAEGGDGDRKADFTGANIRLRLEPTINVTGNIHIVSTIDVLDNLILGSTPDTIPPADGTVPIQFASRGQVPPSDGYNAIVDSFAIKRVYARVTALNDQLELRFGRMPDQFGLGMLRNAGDCLDCDTGDVADRITLSFKAAGHIFTAMFDWTSSGPVIAPFGRGGSAALDAVDWDDMNKYGVRVQKIDHPDDIKDALANDDWVLNYGAWASFGFQFRDLGAGYYQKTVSDGTTTTALPDYDPARPIDVTLDEERQLSPLVTTDAYARFYWKTFTAALEAAFIYGSFSDFEVQQLSSPDGLARQTEILMWGAALELSYQLEGDYSGVKILMNAGVASGDSAPGFGALDQADTQRGFFRGDQVEDRQLTNFQFSPNYHVDLLMYRRVLGTVTDSWYLSPGVSYDFDANININGHITYSQAIWKRSTPSCNDPAGARCRTDKTGDAKREMGVEADAEVSYGLLEDTGGNNFRGALMGGVLFPFGAFTNPELPADQQGANFAWTIQARLYVTF